MKIPFKANRVEVVLVGLGISLAASLLVHLTRTPDRQPSLEETRQLVAPIMLKMYAREFMRIYGISNPLPTEHSTLKNILSRFPGASHAPNEKLMPAKEYNDPWGRAVHYRPSPNDPVGQAIIYSLGPDKIPSSDDISVHIDLKSGTITTPETT